MVSVMIIIAPMVMMIPMVVVIPMTVMVPMVVVIPMTVSMMIVIVTAKRRYWKQQGTHYPGNEKEIAQHFGAVRSRHENRCKSHNADIGE